MKRLHVACLAALALLAPARLAEAESPAGRFKLGIEASLFEYATTENEIDDPTAPVAGSSTEMVSFGIASARTGVDFGYGLADWAVVGARMLLLHGSAEDPGGMDQDSTELGFVPHFDFVFPSSSNTRIFAGPTAGIAIDRASRNKSSTLLFVFGAGFGAHVFVTKGLSIDPRLSLSYAFGKSTFDTDSGGLAPVTEVHSNVRTISMSALIGLSGWL